MKKILLVVALMGFNYTPAQGCSDAGICSVANPFQNSEKKFKNAVEVATLFGAGEADVTYFSSFLSYTRNFNESFALSTKVTYSLASGSFGKRGAFGDAFLIANYHWKSGKTAKWSMLLGMKFPFTSSNLKINNYSLPLDYQSSLGTFDGLAGVNFNYKKWDINAGLQFPIFNSNRNSYFKEFSGTANFSSTNLFERQPDALLRSTYTIQTTNQKFTLKPNLLFIYHLGEDHYENIFGQRETILGSDGLTINGNLIGQYAINTKNSIELSVATPFVIRTTRPDGLTRSFTAALSYKVSF